MTKDKRTALVHGAIDNLERMFGKGTVWRLGERSSLSVEAISTGCLSLDIALGIGGVPRGRVVEIFGPESSGKTTLALQTLAQAQALGGTCAFVDAEHALDPRYAAALGVTVDDLLVSQPDTGEQALEVVDQLTRSGGIDLVVVDSVAALIPRVELEGDMGDTHVGLQARLMSQALRKLTGVVARTGAVVLFINQLRQKIGVTFGNGEVTTGGNALKFYASVRMEIRRVGAIKQADRTIGNRTRIRIVKNKLAPPFQMVEVDIYYGEGISMAADLLDAAMNQGLVTKSGSWFSLGDERLGQGRLPAARALIERVEVCQAVRSQALQDAAIAPAATPAAVEEAS